MDGTQHSTAAASTPRSPDISKPAPPPAKVDPAVLDSWVEAGLITVQQREKILQWQRARARSVAPEAPAGPVASAAMEALAYLGGVVVVVAVSVLVSTYWADLSAAWQIAIPAAACVALFAAGFGVPQAWADTGVRVRAALWLSSSVALVAALVTVAMRSEANSEVAALWISGTTLAYTGALWFAHRAVAQHIATFIALQMVAVSVEGLTRIERYEPVNGAGVAIAVVATLWGLAAYARLLPGTGRWASPAAAPSWARSAARHRRWALGLAAMGAAVGGALIAVDGSAAAWWGMLPVAVVLGAGVALGDLVVLITAAVGTLVVLPLTLGQYLESPVATAMVLLVVGAAMVGLALVVARRHTRRHASATQTNYSR